MAISLDYHIETEFVDRNLFFYVEMRFVGMLGTGPTIAVFCF